MRQIRNYKNGKICIRCEKKEIIVLCAQELWVAAHKEKRMGITIRYKGQNDFLPHNTIRYDKAKYRCYSSIHITLVDRGFLSRLENL